MPQQKWREWNEIVYHRNVQTIWFTLHAYKFFARANQYCISLNWIYNLHQVAYIIRTEMSVLYQYAAHQLATDLCFLLEVWFILSFSEHNKILPCTTKSFIELIGQYIFTIAKNLWHCSCVLINVSPWLVAKVSLIFRDTFLHGTWCQKRIRHNEQPK